MTDKSLEVWDLWYPKAAATGLSFARCKVDPQTVVLVHAAPPLLTVTVRAGNGELKAHGQDLPATQDSPITRLRCQDGKVIREDIWPQAEDIATLVLLPGGEAGFLRAWWHADDHSAWRWTVEFFNHR